MLVIVGAPAKAQVLIDGRQAGEISPDGPFETPVEPGTRRIGLRLGDYDHADRTAEFTLGETVRFSGRELLTPARPPATAAEAPATTGSGPAPISAEPVRPAEPARPATVGMAVLDPNRELGSDGWHSLRGDVQSFLRAEPRGVMSFEVNRKGWAIRIGALGRGKARWVAGYKDQRNHVLFEMDDNNLEWFEVVNGNRKRKGRQAVEKNAEKVKIDRKSVV